MRKFSYKHFLIVLSILGLIGIMPLTLPVLILIIALGFIRYWLPLVRMMFHLMKNFLSFCWKVEVKKSSAKTSQPAFRYRQHGD